MAENNESQNSTKRNKKKSVNFDSQQVISKVTTAFKLPTVREGVLILICFGLLVGLMQINLFPRSLDIQVGQASRIDVRAPRDVLDRASTKLLRQEAVEQALLGIKEDLDYYSFDERVAKTAAYKLNRFFDMITVERLNRQDDKKKPKVFTAETLESYFYRSIDLKIVNQLIELSEEDYLNVREKSYQILNSLETERQIGEFTLEEIYGEMTEIMTENSVDPKYSAKVAELIKASLRPNVQLNEVKINKLKREVSNQVTPVLYQRDDLIISKNQMVTESDIEVLRDLHLITQDSGRIKVLVSLFLLLMLMLAVMMIYLVQFHSGLFKEERTLYLILLLLLVAIGMVKALSLVDTSVLPYLAPVSFVVMLASVLINRPLALFLNAIIALLSGMIIEFSLALTAFYFLSGTVCVLSLRQFTRQRDLVRCGSILMGFNAVTMILLNLIFRTRFEFVSVLLTVGSGFLSSVLAIGSLPFIENVFKMTSPIRLLELANPSHPLLRRLQIEAPGTYQHSIMVGNLAEAAAQGIGADALWVRVGAYYHDIGKIKRPYFFTENQYAQDNPHEKLNATLSTLIVTYHVRDGAELAREYGLPNKLIEIIEQHHGTDLVRYFYNKAIENQEEDKGTVPEEDFRYEGPKPQTKEAALIMLADSVEAAVKSQQKLTPAKLETLVQKIIRERLDGGQFDECNITLKELTSVKNSFMKVLGSMLHSRIEYPEKILKEMERNKNADINK